MEESSRRAVKVLNQRASRELQHKLNMLDKQFKFTCQTLQQRRSALKNQERKVLMVKVCESKATVNIAMEEIQRHGETERLFSRDVRTCEGGRRWSRLRSGPSTPHAERNRSVSAPPAAAQVRRRGKIQSNVSLMQMKNIAAIDSISEKELQRKRQEARERTEELKRLQREALNRKVTQFIEKLKSNKEVIVEPP